MASLPVFREDEDIVHKIPDSELLDMGELFIKKWSRKEDDDISCESDEDAHRIFA